MNWQDWLILGALALNVGLLVWLVARQPPVDGLGDGLQRFVSVNSERLERELRDEVARSGVGTRQEIGQALTMFQQTLLAQGHATRD